MTGVQTCALPICADLKARGIEAVLRRSRGLDIDAACGQLRIARGDRRSREEVPAEPHRHVHETGGFRQHPGTPHP